VPTPADPPSLHAFVPEAEHFVEAHRGLLFKTPVHVVLLDDAAFRARSGGGGGLDPTVTAELHALQLVPRSVDLAAAARRSQAEGVVGLYEPPLRTVLVRGTAPTPFVREVLVHELTHALQDQWFGIDRPQLGSGADERAQAFSALIEGDAVRIEDEYLASLPVSQRQRAGLERDAATGVRGETPTVLAEILHFPYTAGATFVRALATLRGQAGVDAAFRTPPTTSAEILEPQRFLSGAPADAIAPIAPAPAGPVIDRGVLGELGLRLLLEHAAATGAVGDADADAAMSAWHGDAYVAWTRPGLACVRVALAAAPGPAHLILHRVLAAHAARASGVTLDEAPDTLTLTSCG
jgi:hypothetical protein